MNAKRPKVLCPRVNVLCFSGHDPTGGAGIQADIETIAALGGHALTVITAYTVQDTANVSRVAAPEPALFKAQIEALLADCQVDAIKIGLLGSARQIPVLVEVIRRLHVPVVLDPVLRAGGGKNLVSARFLRELKTKLLPRVDVLTPNAAEARRLAPNAAPSASAGGNSSFSMTPAATTLDTCGIALLKCGAKNVLITGGDEPGKDAVNSWHAIGRAPRRFVWPRLPQRFHGAGCTLASAIAVRLAQEHSMAAALQDAQAYTHETLMRAHKIGHGRLAPGRIR